jgi:hypothetical protein
MSVKKNKRLFAFVFLCMIYVSGCSNEADESKKLAASTITTVPTTTTALITEIEPTIAELGELIELSLYTIDSTTAEKVAMTAMVSGDNEITPTFIVDKVVESMADQTFMIGIDDVYIEGDAIIVSFLDNQPPVINVGSSVEGEILDAIAQSLLDNLEGQYQKVIYRVMGKAYSSGHFSFGINQVYME